MLYIVLSILSTVNNLNPFKSLSMLKLSSYIKSYLVARKTNSSMITYILNFKSGEFIVVVWKHLLGESATVDLLALGSTFGCVFSYVHLSHWYLLLSCHVYVYIFILQMLMWHLISTPFLILMMKQWGRNNHLKFLNVTVV